MTYRFAPHRGLIVVGAEVEGPSGNFGLRVALDTGATRTLISEDALRAAGYNPTQAPHQARATTGSGVVVVPSFPLTRIKALGRERTAFSVLCHNLPSTAVVAGLLGLDFLRGLRLTVDFRKGVITLS